MNNRVNPTKLRAQGIQPDCLDCVREGVKPPRPASGSGSYCTKHTYERTKRGKLSTVVREIIDSGEYERLQEKHTRGLKAGLPRFHYADISRMAEKYEKEAQDILARMVELDISKEYEAQDYYRRAVELRTTAQSLLKCRKLTDEELQELVMRPTYAVKSPSMVALEARLVYGERGERAPEQYQRSPEPRTAEEEFLAYEREKSKREAHDAGYGSP